MSNQKPPKKKVVVTTKKQDQKKTVVTNKKTSTAKKKANTNQAAKKATVTKKAPVKARRGSKPTTDPFRSELIISRGQLIVMLIGLAVIFLGLALMTGGSMEDPNNWDADQIYSARRLTLAPILILAGMVLEIVAIFNKFPKL